MDTELVGISGSKREERAKIVKKDTRFPGVVRRGRRTVDAEESENIRGKSEKYMYERPFQRFESVAKRV